MYVEALLILPSQDKAHPTINPPTQMFPNDVIKAIERICSMRVVIKSLQLNKDLLQEATRVKSSAKSGKPPYSPANPTKKQG